MLEGLHGLGGGRRPIVELELVVGPSRPARERVHRDIFERGATPQAWRRCCPRNNGRDKRRCAAKQRYEIASFRSITSSATASSDGGIVSSSAFAVLLLMTNSNRVAVAAATHSAERHPGFLRPAQPRSCKSRIGSRRRT